MYTKFKEVEKRRFKLKAGVYLVLIENDQVLLSRRFQTGLDDGNYVLPSGGHDGSETLTEAMIREANEEVNISLAENDLTMCHVTHRFHTMPQDLSFEQVDFYFRATRYKGTIQNNEPDKCDDLRFFPLNQLPANTLPFISYVLGCIQKGIIYSEFGFILK